MLLTENQNFGNKMSLEILLLIEEVKSRCKRD